MVRVQWSVVSGQWSVVRVQWSVVSGQWSVENVAQNPKIILILGFCYYSYFEQVMTEYHLLLREHLFSG